MVAFWFPHHQRPQVTCVRSQGVEDRVSAQYKVSVSRLAACEGKTSEAGNSRVVVKALAEELNVICVAHSDRSIENPTS